MILDTTFLVDVLRGSDDVVDAMAEIDEAGTGAVSSVSVMEVWEGVLLTTSSDRERRRVKQLLEEVRELEFDRACALRAGEISATLRQAGEQLEAPDVMIAATALAHDMPVVTHNVDHFERVEDLEILTY